MLLETGYVYHIKDEYFEFAKDERLMKNHEDGSTRPTYFCIKDDNSKILWFIPMSSKIEKYKKLQEQKIKKNGVCDTIVIGKYRRKEAVFLIQNIFLQKVNYLVVYLFFVFDFLIFYAKNGKPIILDGNIFGCFFTCF